MYGSSDCAQCRAGFAEQPGVVRDGLPVQFGVAAPRPGQPDVRLGRRRRRPALARRVRQPRPHHSKVTTSHRDTIRTAPRQWVFAFFVVVVVVVRSECVVSTVDAKLSVLVAKNVANTVQLVANRAEKLVATDGEATQVIGTVFFLSFFLSSFWFSSPSMMGGFVII